MLRTALRILVGFAGACFGAGLTMVLFVFTPGEIVGLPPDVAGDRLVKAFELAIAVAVQVAFFSAPLALVAAGLGEALRNREWTFYTIVGLAIAGFGFLAHHSSEQLGQPTIVNNYALTAFLTAGFVGGMMYWVLSGRSAGDPSLRIASPAGGISSAKDASKGDAAS